MKHHSLLFRLSSVVTLFTFLLTGTVHDVTFLQVKNAFAAPTSPSSTAGGFSNLQDSAGLNQSFHTDLFTGRAQTSIPIFTPPGRRGLTPQVALSYGSSNPNGWLGIGWGLDMGFIQRSTKKGVPSYNDNQDIFTFLVQGVNSELIKTTGNEYRAKDESGEFLKFMFQDGYWMVYDKSGTEYTFGQNPAARQFNTRGIFSWCLEKVKDVYGNTIQYTYQKPSSTEMYLSRIDYNSNETQNFPVTHSIEFILESANRPDPTFSYITGARADEKRRLQKIEVKVQSQLARRYNLTYEQSPNVGRSRLKTVQECGTDGSTCLPTQTFTYQDYNLQLEPNYQTITIDNGSQGNYFWNSVDYVSWDPSGPTHIGFFDINGDGISDRVMTMDSGNFNRYRVQLNSGNSFAPIQNWFFASDGSMSQGSIRNMTPNALYGSTFLDNTDLNGDGMPDRVYQLNTSTWRVEANIGSGYQSAFNWQFSTDTTISPGAIRGLDSVGHTYLDLIDMTGDGLLDRVTVHPSDPRKLRVYPNTGNGFGVFSDWSYEVPSNLPPTWTSVISFTAQADDGTKLDTIDLNGDSLPDRVYADVDENGGYDEWKVAFNNGAGFDSLVTWNIFNGNNGAREWGVIRNVTGGGASVTQDLIDINGDGLVDRVLRNAYAPFTKLRVQLNTGSGFANVVDWVINTLMPENDPSGGSVHSMEYTGYLVKSSTRDFDGDGLPDRINVVNGGSQNQWKVARQIGPIPDLLKSINNGRGGVTTFEYKPSTQFDNRDSQGIHRLPFPVHVVTKVTNSDGMGNSYETNISYKGGMFDSVSREFRGFREVTVTDARGTQSITTFLQDEHRRGRPAQVEVKDAQGNLFTKTVNDWGNCADDAYPGVHFVKLRQIDSYLYDGDSTFKQTRKRFQYDQTNGNLLTTYDDGDPNQSTDDRRQTAEYVLNPASYILNTVSKTSVYDHQNTLINEKYFYYDNATDINTAPVKGALTKQEDLLTAGSLQPATKISYDSFGNIQSVTDALNRTTTNEYDPTFKLYLTKVTNTLGYTQEFTYDPLIAQITQTKDQNNQISRTVYDKLGRAVKVISPLDSEASPTQFVLYDDSTFPDRVITKVKVDTAAGSVTNDDQPQTGYLTSYTFIDGLGRTIQKRSPSETAGTQIVSGVVRFDNRGQLKEQYVPYFADFRTTYATPPTNLPHATFTYDTVGRRTRIDFPDSSYSTIQYDDYIKTVTDPNLHPKRYTQDSFGNLIKVEEFNQGQTYTTHYQYDPLNRLIRTIDHLGNTTEVEYDLLGRKTGMFDPNMGVWTYTYDDNNNLLTQTDAKQQTISFQYDELNRLTRKTYPNGIHIDYVYDACPSEACSLPPGANYPIGRLLKVSDSSGIQTFRYDQLGRVIQDKKDLDDGQSYTFTRVYDPQGRVASLEYPDQDILNLTFNSMGEAETLTLIHDSQPTSIINNVDYNASGQITKIEYGNGVTSDYTYNPQTLRLSDLLTKNAQNQTLQQYHYEFDNAGNVESITDSVNTNTQSFLYDDLDRLTQATGSYGAHTFEYNPIGNMTRKNNAILNYSDPNHPHAVTRYQAGSEVINYQYDANGNMTNRGNDTISYDFDNRPIRMQRTTTSGGTCHAVPVDYNYANMQSSETGGSNALQAPGPNPTIARLRPNSAEAISELHTGHEMLDTTNQASSLKIIQPCTRSTTTTHTFGQYIYDASGQRVKKITDNQFQYFLGKDYELIYTSDLIGMGSLTAKKAFFLGATRIAEFETMPQAPGTYAHLRFFHGDHLGSTNIITNETGQQTLLMEYLPYGEVKLRVGTDPVQNTFTGQKEDIESGLMFYNARYYDPKIGRFIQADSIVPNATDPQEFNRYSYVNNNPIKFTDPSGHKKKKKSWWRKALAAYIGFNVGVAVTILTGGNVTAGFAAGFATFRGLDAALSGASFKQTLFATAQGAVEGYFIGQGVQAGLSGAGRGPPGSAKTTFFSNPDGTVGFNIEGVSKLVSESPSKTGEIIKNIFSTSLAYAGENGLNISKSIAAPLLGPKIPVNEFFKSFLSGAEMTLSFRNMFSSPDGPFTFVGNTYNFLNDISNGGGSSGIHVLNGLTAALNMLSGNPILSKIGAAALGFNAGDLVARTRVPGTATSRFGDIYADYLTARDKIQLRER